MPETPEIRWTFEQTGEMTSIVLHDNGGGMPVDVQPHLFRPFFTTKTYGTGLGLVICRRIMDAHGGSVSVETALGQGTEVIIEFPEDTQHG